MQTSLFLGCFLLMTTASAAHGTHPLSVSVGVESDTRYVWRGQTLSDDVVTQPSATVSAFAVSGNLWGNVALGEGVEGSFDLDEVDFTLSYDRRLGPVDVTVGWIEYVFPGADTNGTREVYGTIGFETVYGLGVGLAAFRDVGEVNGVYSALSLGRQFALDRSVALEVELTSSWADSEYNVAYFGVSDPGFGDAGARVRVTYAFSRGYSVTSGVRQVWFWDSRLRDAARDAYGAGTRTSLRIGVSKQW
ncbi:MAG: hypothetical protein DHS20C21_04770 [Gemmatimonadota bacterium]|nr:MAG: hypothetical protein DHS20C21_04770 [Gemmatimonadota bacterium]